MSQGQMNQLQKRAKPRCKLRLHTGENRLSDLIPLLGISMMLHLGKCAATDNSAIR